MYKYCMFYPAGNATAIVFGYEDYSKIDINNEILKKHKDIEQVGFLNYSTLSMAGGEICFNAIRCAAKFCLIGSDKKECEINLNDTIYECGIEDSSFIQERELSAKYLGQDFYYMKIKNNYEINQLSDHEYSVDFGDIFHIIYTKKLDELVLKNFAYEYFQKHNLLNKKACGFMYLDGASLKPIVWVSKIKTLFYESACGSGSFASFLYFNKFLHKDYLALKQPSGEYLFLRKNNDNILLSSIIDDITDKNNQA